MSPFLRGTKAFLISGKYIFRFKTSNGSAISMHDIITESSGNKIQYLHLPVGEKKHQVRLTWLRPCSKVGAGAEREHGLPWVLTLHTLFQTMHSSTKMVYWHQGNNVTFILYSACMKSVLKYLTTIFFCRSNNEGHLGYWRLFGYHPLSIHCHTLHSTGRPLLCCIHRCHPAGFHYPQPGKSCAFLFYQFPTQGTKSCSFQYVSDQK